jgi:hypothetical protein
MDADGVAAATLSCNGKIPLYYPDVPDGTAGFIHKVAIRRALCRKRVVWSRARFLPASVPPAGIRQLQLETDATRPSLMRFYERNGFGPTYRREIREFGQTFLCQYYVLDF